MDWFSGREVFCTELFCKRFLWFAPVSMSLGRLVGGSPMPACSYCGRSVAKTEREHVFPSNLYPPSRAGSIVQRLTIPACRECNGSWSDDEAHFRNVLALSGDNPNSPRRELWQGLIKRSLDEPDAAKRIDDLLALMRPVVVKGAERHMIYPAEDDRILRVIRKIIRGLAYYHQLFQFVPDDKVWVDVQRYLIPDQLMRGMTYHHREADIAEYWYEIIEDRQFHSVWLLRFFEAPSFVGTIHAY